MPKDVSFIGYWENRRESVQSAAARIHRSWELMPREDDAYTRWGVDSWATGTYQLAPVEGEGFTVLEKAVTDRTTSVNEGPRTAPGLYADFQRLTRAEPLRKFAYGARCGFSAPMTNNVSLNYVPDIAHGDTQASVIRAYASALAIAWEPARLLVAPHSFLRLQPKSPVFPKIGWLTFFRDDVSLDTNLLDGRVSIDLADPGRYIQIGGTLLEPNLDDALLVRRALGY